MKIHKLFLSVGNGSSSASLGTDGRRHLVSATSIRAIVTAIAVPSRRCNTRSRFVLTVASSPPIRSIAPLSRVAKPLAWFLVHHAVDGAPNAVILFYPSLHSLRNPCPTTLRYTEQVQNDRQSSFVLELRMISCIFC